MIENDIHSHFHPKGLVSQCQSQVRLAGVSSGWVIGGDQTVQDGEVAPQPVRLLLSATMVAAIAVLLFVNISAELAIAHGHGETPATTTSSSSTQRSQDFEIRLSGDRQATVGQLASQTVQVDDAITGNPEANVIVNTKSIALEDNKQMFAYQSRTDDQGKLTWNEQFFDGTPHQVIAEVTSSSGSALQVSHEVEVEGIEPPLYIRFISLGYYTGTFVLSLWAGIWLHRRSSRSFPGSQAANSKG